MNQVLSWLSGGDLRSDGMSDEVANFVLQNPPAFEDLFAGLSDDDDLVRARAADAIEKAARKRPGLTRIYLPEMVSLAEQERVPMVKMHLAMIFGHLAIYPELVGQLLQVLLFQLADESVFTRSWAVASLSIIARKYPEKCKSILEYFVPLQADESIAIRSRAAKAIKLLTDPSMQFPPGWIKSEHLQDI